jgi:tRNA dimethylallyltransferase
LKKPSVTVIVGPTAIGKTDLAIKLAQTVGGEIISADSMQAYKRMEIMTQQPTTYQRRRIRHHLVRFLDPSREYSCALFARMARESVQKILKARKMPIVAGGSGLYIKALIDGLFPSRGKDAGLRKRLQETARRKGVHVLYGELEGLDPQAAGRIHPNDERRIIRALEICRLDRGTKTSLTAKTYGIARDFRVTIFGLTMKRELLYQRIDERVDEMFRQGIVAEVKKLNRRSMSATSRKALGVRQVGGFLDGEYDRGRACYLLKRDTRRFAKRQLTWFRPDRRVVWLDVEKLGEDEVVRRMAEALGS